VERSLSALIAVRNAEFTLRANVQEMLDVLSELTSRLEVLIVDDCSSDGTIEVADELAAIYPQVRVLRHATPRGRGATLATALVNSVGEIVFFADDDCRLALDPIRRLWAAMDGHDLVLGCRFTPGHDTTDGSPYKPYEGGYQMGYRRVLLELNHALGDQPTLIAELRRLGIPWYRVQFSGTYLRRCGIGFSIGSEAWETETSPFGRLRADRPAEAPGKPPRSRYAARLKQFAADQ
jgi:glycosyltransferase involved in cell wall biosynthesis